MVTSSQIGQTIGEPVSVWASLAFWAIQASNRLPGAPGPGRGGWSAGYGPVGGHPERPLGDVGVADDDRGPRVEQDPPGDRVVLDVPGVAPLGVAVEAHRDEVTRSAQVGSVRRAEATSVAAPITTIMSVRPLRPPRAPAQDQVDARVAAAASCGPARALRRTGDDRRLSARKWSDRRSQLGRGLGGGRS